VVEKIFVTVAEAAEMLALSKSQVYELASGGRLTKRYIGSRDWRLAVEEIREYADSRPTTGAPADA
jgi:excisionase family DNA binding protein